MKQALEELLAAIHSQKCVTGTVCGAYKIKDYYILIVWHDEIQVCIPIKSKVAWRMVGREIDFIPVRVSFSMKCAFAEIAPSGREQLLCIEKDRMLTEQVAPA